MRYAAAGSNFHSERQNKKKETHELITPSKPPVHVKKYFLRVSHQSGMSSARISVRRWWALIQFFSRFILCPSVAFLLMGRVGLCHRRQCSFKYHG